MDIKLIIEGLNSSERKVLPFLSKYSGVEDIVNASGLKEIEVMRALQWLENKKIVELESESKEVVALEKNGQRYLKEGLPEKRFLRVIVGKELKIDDLKKAAKLDDSEVNICIGLLKQKNAVIIRPGMVFVITEQGKRLVEKESLEEKFLKELSKKELAVSELSSEDKFALEALRRRKEIVRVVVKKIKSIKITVLGKEILKLKISPEGIDRVTPEILKTGGWKGKNFRRYDVEINVPKIFAAKKQHYRAFHDWTRKKLMALGFEEMTGPIVETNFWDMDALFMPQFHSARDIHSAYYIKEPKYEKLDEKIVQKVKEAHEKGVAGSRGWRYNFDVKETHRQLLRTQGTACSARMLGSKDLKIPGKYFGMTRCFRPDVVDATHNVDFNQIEGIVVEDGLNFRHLVGLLKMFAKEFAGTDKIRIVPGYFPFTEPSAELFAKHPELGWIELGGAGIFRPELVKPLVGREVSVLAWGIGIDRIAMFKLGINDIRQLFSHDLEFLRKARVI